MQMQGFYKIIYGVQ